MTTTENRIERDFVAKLNDLKYAYRPDLRDRATPEANFHWNFYLKAKLKLRLQAGKLNEKLVRPWVC